MAAGLGFKTFAVGEVLTAADTNGYLMQGVLVFASAAARDAAITSPQEGQFAYLKDTNVTTYYTGSAWANLDTTGMTNPMTTTGDTIYSSSGSTPARLGIGSTGQVLTVAGGVPSWATPAGGGGMTLLSTTTLSGATTVVSSIDQTYVNLFVMIAGMTNNTADGAFRVGINNSTNSHDGVCTRFEQGGSASISGFANNYLITPTNLDRTNPTNTLCLLLPSYTGGNGIRQTFNMFGRYTTAAASTAITISGMRGDTSAITSLGFSNSGGNLSAGTVLIYGVK